MLMLTYFKFYESALESVAKVTDGKVNLVL